MLLILHPDQGSSLRQAIVSSYPILILFKLRCPSIAYDLIFRYIAFCQPEIVHAVSSIIMATESGQAT